MPDVSSFLFAAYVVLAMLLGLYIPKIMRPEFGAYIVSAWLLAPNTLKGLCVETVMNFEYRCASLAHLAAVAEHVEDHIR